MPSDAQDRSPRYASHILRLGAFVARRPLVAWSPGEGLSLGLFTAEVERTIFLSGALELRHPAFPLQTMASPEEVSLEVIAELLSQHDGWELYHEGKLLLPPKALSPR